MKRLGLVIGLAPPGSERADDRIPVELWAVCQIVEPTALGRHGQLRLLAGMNEMVHMFEGDYNA